MLTSAQVFPLSEGTKDFLGFYYASRVDLGCDLIQNKKVVAYPSRKLWVHDPIQDLELAVMVFDYKICRHYFCGVHVDGYTDHKSVQ